MTKQETFRSRVDLQQFFEASVNAVQQGSESLGIANRTGQRNAALVQRAATSENLKNRAVADAARALAALWKIQTSKRTA